ESGFMQHEIGDSAYAAQRALESKNAIVVGVNDFVENESATLPILMIDESVERDQVARLLSFRETRTNDWQRTLASLDAAARDGEAVILRRDLDASIAQILDGMIAAAMSELQFVGAAT